MRLHKLPAIVAVLALAAGLPACAGAKASPGETVVTINHSRFNPQVFEFGKGEVVTFVLVNDDPIDHEFILGDKAVQDQHETGTDARHSSIPSEVSVPAGKTVRTTVTFDEPADLIIGCHLPTHYSFGMRADVKVV